MTALEFFLGPAYPGALAPVHLADQRKSGLHDETIQAHAVRSVPLSLLRPLLEFDTPKVDSAVLFPYPDPAGGFFDHVRMKVWPTDLTDAPGHAVRYLQRRGSAPRLYFTHASRSVLADASVPLYLVEGEKKALRASQLGLAAIGFAGIEGWHVRGSDDLSPRRSGCRT